MLQLSVSPTFIAAAAAIAFSLPVSASFIGTDVSGQIAGQATETSSPIQSEYSNLTVIGDTVEYPDAFAFRGGREAAPGDLGNLLDIAIDFSESSIFLDYSAVRSGRYSTAFRDGYLFSFFGPSSPSVSGVTFDPSATNLSLTDSDLEFTPDSIFLNLSGTSYSSGTRVKLDITFDPSVEPPSHEVTAPATAILLLAGLAGMASTRTRKA